MLTSAPQILVPGGFGSRGVEGMVKAAQFARERKIPYLGICLGLQVAVIEAARNLSSYPKATSEEFEGLAEDKVVMYMPEVSKE